MNAGRDSERQVAALLLNQIRAGDDHAADELMPLVYDELRGLAQSLLRWERPGHTLQATALVNEACLRMLGQSEVAWQGKAHFRAIAAIMIRRVLVDHARSRQAAKRGGEAVRLTLHDEVNLVNSGTDPLDLLALHEAMDRLEKLNPRQARVVELRFFAGMSVDETALVVDVSPRTVKEDWRFARAWLRRQIYGENR